MRFPLIVPALLGAIVTCHAQAALASEDQDMLAGRWQLTATDMPVALPLGEYIVIESRIIRVKRDCNEVTLSYSLKAGELNARPITTTLLACSPLNMLADENRLVYDALLHSRYQIDGGVLRLFSLKDSALDYSLEFHRVQ